MEKETIQINILMNKITYTKNKQELSVCYITSLWPTIPEKREKPGKH